MGLIMPSVRVIDTHLNISSRHMSLQLSVCPKVDPTTPSVSVVTTASVRDEKAIVGLGFTRNLVIES